MACFFLHFSVATRKFETIHMVLMLFFFGQHSFGIFKYVRLIIYRSTMQIPFSYLVPSYKNLSLDPILPSQYIPIPLLTFRAWPPEKPGSTNCFHFCSHYFTETDLLEGTYYPQDANSSCHVSAPVLLISPSWSFPASWNAFLTWLPGHHALFWFSSSASPSIFPTLVWYLNTRMSLG